MKQFDPQGMGQSLALGRGIGETRKIAASQATTVLERCLLLASTVLLPLQDQIPAVAGFSAMWVLFAVLAGYVLLNRPRKLLRTLRHPLFWTAYSLVGVACLVEPMHPYPSFVEIFRIAQMFTGAVLVACLCRDRKALRTAIYGYIIVGAGLSILLYSTSYGALSSVKTSDFQEATQLRADAMGNNNKPLAGNINNFASLMAQGAAAALALTLTSPAPRRYVFLIITLFCLSGSFLPMSRGAVAAAVISCAIVMFASGVSRGRVILVASLVGAGIVVWTPDAVWSRMTFSTEYREGTQEARAQVYTAALGHLPEYWATGVGVGNYWESWGRQSQFVLRSGLVGPHNCFLAATIYWGVAGLLSLVAVIWQAYRCLPKIGKDALALALLGTSVCLLGLMMCMHNLPNKEFSLGLGLLVGAHQWIWPKRVLRIPVRPGGSLLFRQGQ